MDSIGKITIKIRYTLVYNNQNSFKYTFNTGLIIQIQCNLIIHQDMVNINYIQYSFANPTELP